MEFLEPWFEVTSEAHQLQRELAAELGPGHRLRGRDMQAVARRQGCDDVLFVSVDEPRVVAVVHLTYSNGPEPDPRWPGTMFFDSMQDWIERCMKPDHEDYMGEPAVAGLARELERATQILKQHGFALEFGPGVTPDELARAERLTGLPFDNALGELFGAANGSFGKTCFAIQTDDVTPCSLASLDECLRWWSEWRPYGADIDAQFGPGEAGRDPRIRPDKFVHAKWFPFAEFNGWGTTVYFDTDPGVAGQSGQVIAYQHDPDAMYFVADDIAAFLARSNALLERHARDLLFVDGRPSVFSPKRL